MKKEKHKIIPASYLVLKKDEKVLLLRRFNTGYEDGKYSLVAGHVESGESFTQCVIREAKEEAGVDLDPRHLKVGCMMHRDSGTEKDSQRIDSFFVAEKWEGEIENKESHKCDDLSWFHLDEIPENIIPYIKKALENIKNNIFYDEHGWCE
ncbi:NUDIX domain-containing protein [Patescibacteria group bacterium]